MKYQYKYSLLITEFCLDYVICMYTNVERLGTFVYIKIEMAIDNVTTGLKSYARTV